MFTIWPASTVFRSALRLQCRQFTPRSFPFHDRRVEPRLQFSRLLGPLLCSRKIPDRGIESLGQRIAFLERGGGRSEEHTSELQSLLRISYAVLCLKKKSHNNTTTNNTNSLHT